MSPKRVETESYSHVSRLLFAIRCPLDPARRLAYTQAAKPVFQKMTPESTAPHERPGKLAVALFLFVVLAGIAIRLPLLPLAGTNDQQIWKIWSYAGATHKLYDIYRLRDDARVPTTPGNIRDALSGKIRPGKWQYGESADYLDYPPILPLSFGVMGKLYKRAAPEYEDTPTLNALVKLPGLLSELVTLAVVTWAAYRMRGRRVALLAGALIWLNPLAVLAGPLLGYLDPVYAAALVICALLVQGGRHAWAWVAYATSVLIKPQAMVAAPALLVASLARRSFSRLVGYVAAAGLTVLVWLLPFLLGGTLVNLLANNMLNATEIHLSAYNANLWWLGSFARQTRDLSRRYGDLWLAMHEPTKVIPMPRLIAEGHPDPRIWGLVFFASFTLIVVGAWWLRFGNTPEAREGRSPAVHEAMAFQLYGATMLLTQVHENHAYGAVALLGATWWMAGRGGRLDRELLAIYMGLSAVVFLDIVIFYGFGETIGGWPVPRMVLWVDLSVLVALLNFGIFGWWLWRWVRDVPALRRLGRGQVRAASEPVSAGARS